MPKLNVKRLADITLVLDGEEERITNKKKRVWVHKCQLKRKLKGEFWTLCKELQDDEMTFYQYFRMSKSLFSYLLQKIEEDLLNTNTSICAFKRLFHQGRDWPEVSTKTQCVI